DSVAWRALGCSSMRLRRLVPVLKPPVEDAPKVLNGDEGVRGVLRDVVEHDQRSLDCPMIRRRGSSQRMRLIDQVSSRGGKSDFRQCPYPIADLEQPPHLG